MFFEKNLWSSGLLDIHRQWDFMENRGGESIRLCKVHLRKKHIAGSFSWTSKFPQNVTHEIKKNASSMQVSSSPVHLFSRLHSLPVPPFDACSAYILPNLAILRSRSHISDQIVADFVGEVVADFLGLTQSRYQYVVDAHDRYMREVNSISANIRLVMPLHVFYSRRGAAPFSFIDISLVSCINPLS